MCFPNVAEVQIVLIVRSSTLIKAPKVLNLSRGAGNPWACLEGFSCVSWLPGQVQPCSQWPLGSSAEPRAAPAARHVGLLKCRGWQHFPVGSKGRTVPEGSWCLVTLLNCQSIAVSVGIRVVEAHLCPVVAVGEPFLQLSLSWPGADTHSQWQQLNSTWNQLVVEAELWWFPAQLEVRLNSLWSLLD